MKKPNFTAVITQFKALVFRFPVATFFCIASFLVFLNAIARWYDMSEAQYLVTAMVASLGFALSLSSSIFAEDKEWKGWLKRIDVLVIPLMIFYFVLLISEPELSTITAIRYIVFSTVASLLITIAAYTSTKQPMLLWRYNVKIILRMLFVSLCTAILYLGFLCAIWATDALFDASFSERYYLYLTAFFFTLFLPLFFIIGIPSKAQICEIKSYQPLKFIGQYILIPILATYLIILYAYGIKILITWELPKGLLSWLIFAFSGAGLLIFFMLHNLYITKATKISTFFGKWFFFAEIPLLALLFVAILRRVMDYGITENRYYILLAACWLLGIAIYMIVTKGRSFRPVIISFLIVALFSIFGPWSAFSVSDRSQYNRLEKLFEENGLLEDGKFVVSETSQSLDYEVAGQCKEVLSYFAKKDNVECLQPLFTCDVNEVLNDNGRWSFPDVILSGIEVDPDDAYVTEESSYYNYSANIEKEVISTTGYDFLVYYEYSSWMEIEDVPKSELREKPYVVVTRPNAVVEVYSSGQLFKSFDLKKLLARIESRVSADESNYVFSHEELSVVDQHCKIVFKDIMGYRDEENPINRAEMYILLKVD